MSSRRTLGKLKRRIKRRKKKLQAYLQPIVRVLVIGTAVVVAIIGVFQISSNMNKKSVYAAAGENMVTLAEQMVPTGLAGVISGVFVTELPAEPVKRIGTSCEKVIVGQRTFHVDTVMTGFDMSDSVEATVKMMNDTSMSHSEEAKMMSDTDYETLLSIVEAEAGGEDIKGKVLVANVIMNRVKSEQFPDSITEVVWEQSAGIPQFSPTYDGRINTVTVSKETERAVKLAMDGTDYSKGALFFVAKEQAEKKNVTWFDSDLEHLFEYGVHDFYTFPDLANKYEQSGQVHLELP